METKYTKHQRAQARVQVIKKFHKNVRNLVFFIILFGSLNYYSNGLDYPWFLWIIGAMSIGLSIDAFRTFVRPLILRRWEQRKIDELMHSDNF